MASDQLVLISKEVNGIDMGVLDDGTPYLTGRGLARLCGVVPSAIINQAATWQSGGRTGKFARILVDQGFDEDSLYIKTVLNGTEVHAYPDIVCMAFLEYYAYEVPSPSEIARGNHRLLARSTLRRFIYTALGYVPNQQNVPLPWRQFHDRMLLHSVPIGYFSVFKETADFVIAAIRGGLRVDHETVPDISVGIAWGKFWDSNDLGTKHGERIKYPHNYPDYFPQAASNPQPIWMYPVSALGDFRVWMLRVYLTEKFPSYLGTKVKKGVLAASTAEIMLTEMQPPEELTAPTGGDEEEDD